MGLNLAALVLVAGLLASGCETAPPAATAQPQGSDSMSSTQAVLDRHMSTFGSQDMAGILADYAPEAVLFTPNGPVRGTEELRKMFEGMFVEWAKPGVIFELKQQIVDGNHAYVFWDAETADNVYEAGSDGFVVENGKIVAQFFSAKITPKAGAQ
jgi:ketosteroid isomerase-like protein